MVIVGTIKIFLSISVNTTVFDMMGVATTEKMENWWSAGAKRSRISKAWRWVAEGGRGGEIEKKGRGKN